MTMKEEKPIFFKTLILIGVLVVVESIALSLLYRPPSLSGFAVIDVTRIYAEMHPSSRLFLIVQWSLIVLILLVVFVKNRGILKRKHELSGLDVKSAMSRSKTNLDALYLVLKDRKELSVRSIARLFDISDDLAVEWARILELGELVTIEYPAIGGPVVFLKESKPDDRIVGVGNKDSKVKSGVTGKVPVKGAKSKVVSGKVNGSSVSSRETRLLKKRVSHLKRKHARISQKRSRHVLKKVKKLKRDKKKT